MNKLKQLQPSLTQISLALALFGLLAGFILALGVLAGDSQGRVNLLYLLLLFAFLPVAGLLISLLTLALGMGSSLSAMLLRLPWWPGRWQRETRELAQFNARKSWFMYQTQVLALSFGLGGLLAFFILLIGSDVSFVWRSTLLQAQDVLPLLRALALPWLAWEEAQPSLALLQQTRDFRLLPAAHDEAVLGQWWKYVFAAQCTYNLLPRLVMLLVFRAHYRKKFNAPDVQPEAGPPPTRPLNAVAGTDELAPVQHELKQDYVLVNWAAAPEFCLEHVGRHLSSPQRVLRAGPLATPEEEDASLHSSHVPVVLVKSWEPPMGELKDYLQAGKGLILPLDWEAHRVKPPIAAHLQEWQRFCGELDNWGLLQIPSSQAMEKAT